MNSNLNDRVVELLDTLSIAINYLKVQIGELRFEDSINMLLDINDALDSINRIRKFSLFATEILKVKQSILDEMIAIDRKEFDKAVYVIIDQLEPKFSIFKLKMEKHINDYLN